MTKIIKILTLTAMAVTLSGCIIAIGDDWDDNNYTDSSATPESPESPESKKTIGKDE